jgi:hypothetical protein
MVQKFDGWKPEPKPDWWMSREALLELARLMEEEQKPKAEWDPKLLEQLPPGWWPTSEDKGEGTP